MSTKADQVGDRSSPIDPKPTDGRRLRRETNRQAVVEALAQFHDEGYLDPTIDEIAERSGVSARSVFRYFADVDDLVSEAVALQQRRLAPVLALSINPEDSLDDRLGAFVAHRLRLLAAMGNTALVARMQAHTRPIVAAEVTRMRRLLRSQIAETFDPELAQLPPDLADRRVAALDVLASFEAERLWREDHGLDSEQVVGVLTEALRSVLTAGAQAKGAKR